MVGHRLWSLRGVPVTSGVPQGSVLGPILFLVYINDLPEKVKSQVRLFADDTAAYLAIAKPAESKQLQDDLDTLQEWELDWNMEFNPGKCQVIRITRSRSPIPTQYSLHGQTLEVVASARYLGVDIANDLSWKPHITRITNNANKSLGFLRRNLKAKNPELRELTYKAIVRPQLEYAAPVWDPYIQEDIQRIEMVQRRAARWVLSDYSPYSSVSDMLGRLGWRTLEQRRADSRLVLFYKIVPFHSLHMSYPSIGILGQLIHWLLDNSMLGLTIINTRISPWQWYSGTIFRPEPQP